MTFDTPFSTACYTVVVVVTSCHEVVTTPLGAGNVSRTYTPIVEEYTIGVNGFTVQFFIDETGTPEYITFRYMAIGH